MMNYIWSGMIIIGLLLSYINNTPDVFTDGLMLSCSEAVTFMISLSGIMAVWSGLMEIAEKSGLIEKLSNAVMPIMRFLFPDERDKETIALMLMSFTANVFGAGNSATVFSLKAMERLDISNRRQIYASNTMCMFTAVSMSMIQLVPISIIKIRQDLDSLNPGSIILPSIAAGLVSMLISIIFCKYCERQSYI